MRFKAFSWVVVYFEDILVCSKNKEDHLHHLEEVFKVVRAPKIY